MKFEIGDAVSIRRTKEISSEYRGKQATIIDIIERDSFGVYPYQLALKGGGVVWGRKKDIIKKDKDWKKKCKAADKIKYEVKGDA